MRLGSFRRFGGWFFDQQTWACRRKVGTWLLDGSLPRSSSREVRISWYQRFSMLSMLEGEPTPPKKETGEKGTILGDPDAGPDIAGDPTEEVSQ